MRKPSFKQAEWIHGQLANMFRETADDVYDVLLGNISSPADFVQEVKYLALEYEEDMRRHNAIKD
jgi:hypothetical protein